MTTQTYIIKEIKKPTRAKFFQDLALGSRLQVSQDKDIVTVSSQFNRELPLEKFNEFLDNNFVVEQASQSLNETINKVYQSINSDLKQQEMHIKVSADIECMDGSVKYVKNALSIIEIDSILYVNGEKITTLTDLKSISININDTKVCTIKHTNHKE